MEPPKIWRERSERYLGIGIQCQDCGEKNFPKTRQCPSCASENVVPYRIAQFGKLEYFTQVKNTGEEMIFYTPYIIGIIELDDGIRVTAQLVDCDYENLKKGMRVRMVFRVLAKNGKNGLIRYGFKFAPA
ncbi:MAG: Zn-ribbon domain-containing OB-fold protein [Candidatus Heimdallarchaeaceae archaeon]